VNCDEARPLVSAYQDGELDSAKRSEVETHLQSCPDCAALLKQNQRLSNAIGEIGAFEPSAALLQRPAESRLFWRPFTVGLTAGLATAAALVFLYFGVRRPNITADLVTEHVRSLMADHLFDVASSDRHTVKPWFLGKVDFAPTVPDLGADGYPLVGGRLDYIDGHPCAALVYMKARHVINVFVLPDSEAADAGEKGYNIERWDAGGLHYWAVSDVAREDLRAFAEIFRRRS
jgi:anti-sigma factor RsiW